MLFSKRIEVAAHQGDADARIERPVVKTVAVPPPEIPMQPTRLASNSERVAM